MITKMKEDGFTIVLGIVTVASAAFVLTVMARMAGNMSGIL